MGYCVEVCGTLSRGVYIVEYCLVGYVTCSASLYYLNIETNGVWSFASLENMLLMAYVQVTTPTWSSSNPCPGGQPGGGAWKPLP